ncbi:MULTISPECIES: hypothetical protein [Bacillus]|uniref:Uncharacterized protein n=2 Tax=Bacillus cereus group TaxID=86661 RepID=A0A1C4FH19_9BACI|nr:MULTISPECIES: hypothetical protein [Bacillus]RBP25575.1 hypothetical protein DET63_110216 [Bacillus sp. DB-2]REF17675.1 hypothetical protein DET55_14526 [Bacillus mycoides]SCC55164.1 Uncharacterized protein BC05F1_04435 [Bacillus wiedmannii]
MKYNNNPIDPKDSGGNLKFSNRDAWKYESIYKYRPLFSYKKLFKSLFRIFRKKQR